MTCRDALEILADYLDGRLTLAQQVAFRLHLGLCPDCRNYLDSYRQTVQATIAVRGDQAECESLPEDLVQAILAARQRGSNTE